MNDQKREKEKVGEKGLISTNRMALGSLWIRFCIRIGTIDRVEARLYYY